MSGSDRSMPGRSSRRIEHDAAVSEIIGAVLLIALVVAGATMVGVALFSQPLPSPVPKMTFLAGSDESGTLIIYHTGGEELKSGTYRVRVNGTEWPSGTIYNYPNLSSSAGDWMIGQGLAQKESGGWKTHTAEYAENVTVEYFGGGAGNVSIATVRSNRTSTSSSERSGFGFFSAWYEYIAEFIVPLPQPVQHYSSVRPQWLANMSPQINFTLDPSKQIFLYASDTSQTEIDTVRNANPGVPVEPCTNPATNSNTIRDALYNNGWVILLNGTYDCTGPIVCSLDYRILEAYNSDIVDMPMHTSGDNEGYIKVSSSNVIIRGLNLYGTGGVKIVASDPSRWTTDVSIQNVNVTSRSFGEHPDPNVPPSNKAPINGMFFVWADKNSLNNIEFYNCTARECNTHGWNMNQNYDDGVARTISNTRFVNCRASYCGYGVAGDPIYGGGSFDSTHISRSEWITGFDLHEWQDLVSCQVFNCTADNNWESGFHFEPGARYDDNGGDIGPRTVSEDVTLDNCTSTDNGRSTYDSRFFLSGYYLSRNTTLTNCIAANNTNAGFYVHGGNNADFENCTDTGSGQAGFFVIKGSSDITINNCIAQDSPGYALWAAFTDNLQVTNFHQKNYLGSKATQSILGWYKDDPRYGLPVTNSHFRIFADSASPPIINRDGSGNTYDLTPS